MMLVVVETAEQATWCYENRRTLPENQTLLAITPTAAVACQQLSLPYIKLEDHSNYAQRFDEYPAILESYISWETALDDRATELVPELRIGSFRPARAVTFLLQLLVAEIWATATNLQELVADLRPERISFWSPRRIEVPWFLQPPVAPAAALMPALQFSSEIEKTDLSKASPELAPVCPTKPTTVQLNDRVKQSLRQSTLFTELEGIKAHGIPVIVDYLRTARPKIVTTGLGYDLEPVILELRRRGVAITRLKDNTAEVFTEKNTAHSRLQKKLRLMWPAIAEEFAAKYLAPWRLDSPELFLKSLSFWWHSLVPVLWSRYRQTRALLERKSFVALLTTDCGATTWGGPDCQAAFDCGITRWSLQHGGSTGLNSKFFQMYLRNSDVFLATGEGTIQELEYTRPSILRGQGRLVATGSSRLDKIRRHSVKNAQQLRSDLQAGDPRPVVLYIPNSFGTYGRAISDLAAYPEVSYLELQQNVLRTWTEFLDVRLLYKELIVANDPNRVMSQFIQQHIPNGTVTSQRLTDLMWAVDAIVVDHPITALGEVLLTKKQVVAYMPKPNASHPQAKVLLAKRARVAETPAEFVDLVRDFLMKRDFNELAKPDDQFLRWYCTNADDGRSAERAANEILNACTMEVPKLASQVSG